MKMSILLLILSGCIACTGNNTQNRTISDSFQEKKDTVVNISKKRAIVFLIYDEDMELWYDPYIINCETNDTLKIKDHTYENGSELNMSISSNKEYIVIDHIIKGYVEIEEGKSELYENYTCEIIDIMNAKVVFTMQEHCGGEWNDNVWIDGDEIIFDANVFGR